jgi:hypothetical protein
VTYFKVDLLIRDSPTHEVPLSIGRGLISNQQAHLQNMKECNYVCMKCKSLVMGFEILTALKISFVIF